MLVLGFDVETTGLDPFTDEIIEIGAVIWDTERATPIRMFSEMIRPRSGGNNISQEVQDLTGILPSDLRSFGIDLAEACNHLVEMVKPCSYYVCHSGIEFDRRFLISAFESTGLIPKPLPWIDTALDIEFSVRIANRKLEHLAPAHDFLPMFSHRALFDVLSMLRILSKYDFKTVSQNARSSVIRLRAKLSYEDREKALRAGFHWNGDLREWQKSVRSGRFRAGDYPFEVTQETLYSP